MSLCSLHCHYVVYSIYSHYVVYSVCEVRSLYIDLYIVIMSHYSVSLYWPIILTPLHTPHKWWPTPTNPTPYKLHLQTGSEPGDLLSMLSYDRFICKSTLIPHSVLQDTVKSTLKFVLLCNSYRLMVMYHLIVMYDLLVMVFLNFIYYLIW